MAKDEVTYSEAVRAAAAEAAAALGTNGDAVRQRPRRQPGNDGKARVLLDVDAQKDKAAPRKRPDVCRAYNSRTFLRSRPTLASRNRHD
jgi:hypothetical protein